MAISLSSLIIDSVVRGIGNGPRLLPVQAAQEVNSLHWKLIIVSSHHLGIYMGMAAQITEQTDSI